MRKMAGHHVGTVPLLALGGANSMADANAMAISQRKYPAMIS